MGWCCIWCYCCAGDDNDNNNNDKNNNGGGEMELSQQNNHNHHRLGGGTAACESMGGTSLSMSRAMTAPTIEVVDSETNTVSGHGLALASVVLEQDAAYWEVHVDISSSSLQGSAGNAGIAYEVLFGVATRKDRKFYHALEKQQQQQPTGDLAESERSPPPPPPGTELMRPIPVSDKDVVGIAVQHNDLPMVQFLLNGEPLHSLAVNRFRGSVFPAVYLPDNDGTLSLRMVFAERDFQQLSPHARFGPVIVARGIL